MSAWLQTKSWEEAKEAIARSKGVAIVPIGSVEQHSYHLPLGTDTYVAMTIAEEAAEKTGAVLTPPVWFGWSPHHMVLPGTVTIRPEVLSELTYDIIESLNAHGLNKIILINGHRIVNVVWMQICAQKAQSKLGCTVKIFDPAYMSKDIVKELGFGPVGHAEEVETSHMMARYPDMVHLEKAIDNPIKDTPLYSVDPTYEHDTPELSSSYIMPNIKAQSVPGLGAIHSLPKNSPVSVLAGLMSMVLISESLSFSK